MERRNEFEHHAAPDPGDPDHDRLHAGIGNPEAEAATAAEIDQKVDLALEKLYRDNPAAKTLSEKAKAVLVFPEIVKGGFIVGGQYGEGALRKAGAASGYYSIASASFGLQAGAQSFAEALFFMSDEALSQLTKDKGFELGVDASVTVADTGKGGQALDRHHAEPDHRLRLRPAGADGRHLAAGLQGHQNPAVRLTSKAAPRPVRTAGRGALFIQLPS